MLNADQRATLGLPQGLEQNSWRFGLRRMLLGYAVASLQMYRFAAVELAPPAFRARAISWVTAGGVLAGTIGPTVVRATSSPWLAFSVS